MKNIKNTLSRIFIFVIFLLFLSISCTFGQKKDSHALNENSPIAVWAFPDSSTVRGKIKIGVSAYHSTGINRVDFSLNDVFKMSVNQETRNTDTGEYEYVFELNSVLLQDGPHRINAVVISNSASGTQKKLPELIIYIANKTLIKTWYVDASSGRDSNNGEPKSPWKTLGRALGTQFGTQNSVPRARGGDTVLLRPGIYDLPDQRYGTFNQYITIKPQIADTVTVRGGVLRSPFIKFEGIKFSANTSGGITIYSHHIWFKNCIYTGFGKIWPDTINRDEAIRSRNTNDSISHNVIVENCTVNDANQGISLIGRGNYIIRNCEVYDQNGDGMKFMGNDILITGNRIHHIASPKGWTVSKKSGPYNCAGINLVFHISNNYGKTFPTTFKVPLSGNRQTASQIIAQLNEDSGFKENGFTAELSASPYPYAGNIRIEKSSATETHRFYITGDTPNIFNFSDNTRKLNNISQTTPAMNSTDHSDYIANDAGNSSNVIIRNNKMWDGKCQGIKMDSIGGKGYKKNIAIVNNLLTGGIHSSTMFYMNYRGSGSPASYISYYNVFFANNTVIRPSTGFIRACISIDMTNPNLNNIIIKNNILGNFFHGDWPFENSGISDYNLFTDMTHRGRYSRNRHSVLGDPAFKNVDLINNWDFRLGEGSKAKAKGDPSLKIKYDIDWNPRSLTSPSIGCYE